MGEHSGHARDDSADPAAAQEPSMEEILASIRRILSEDDAPGPKAERSGVADPRSELRAERVVTLEESMIVEEPPGAPARGGDAGRENLSDPGPDQGEAPTDAAGESPIMTASSSPPIDRPIERPLASHSLVAPEAAAAAASSVGSLLRTIGGGARSGLPIARGGGPTLEDIVRDELRPLLKEWLDANLPPLVERLVRAEIERVVGRAGN